MNLFKIIFFTILFIFVSNMLKAQFGVSYHQYLDDNLVSLNYKMNKFRPEFRFGVNRVLEEIALELDLNYQFIRKENFNFYAGIGYNRDLSINSLVFPIGLNIYPFEMKQFGFLMEIKPTFSDYFDNSLRGSIGIQYHFSFPN